MKFFGKFLQVLTLIGSTSLFGCEAPPTNAYEPDTDIPTTVYYPEGFCERGNGKTIFGQCVREVIYLNFKGVQLPCSSSFLKKIFTQKFCPPNADGSANNEMVSIEGFEGFKDPEAEKADIVRLIRCYFEPLGFDIVTEKPESGHYNQVNIGGEGALNLNENTKFIIGISELDYGNSCHDNDILVAEKVRISGQIEGLFRIRRNIIATFIVHELGHSLGLGHTEYQSSFMAQNFQAHAFSSKEGEINPIFGETCDRVFSEQEATALTENMFDSCDKPDINNEQAVKETINKWTFENRCDDICSQISANK